ncbi:MAG: isocitrate lyase/PEP mutase family protein [Actinomycetota bacterium]
MSNLDARAAFADRIRSRRFTVAPGVYDMVSARIADAAGFDALYMTGYGVSASHLGLPDAGLSSFTDMLDRARTIAAGTATPLIADADTGFGGLLNVRHTARGYEAAGVAAIQLEDQEFPKKCGHAQGRRVISTADMVRKVEVAVEARTDPTFLVIARTDARSALGLDEAIARGRAYAAAGADVIFVESPESEDEFAAIADGIDAPLVANMVEGGFSPVLSGERLAELGFTIGLFPVSGLAAAVTALTSTYRTLRGDGASPGVEAGLTPIGELHRLMGFDDVAEFDARWAEDGA